MSKTNNQVDPNVQYLAETLQEAVDAASPVAQEALSGLRSEVRATGIVYVSLGLIMTIMGGYLAHKAFKVLDRPSTTTGDHPAFVLPIMLGLILCCGGVTTTLTSVADITQPTIVLIERVMK